MTVYSYVDTLPQLIKQGEVVRYFATRPQGALFFSQTTLSCKLWQHQEPLDLALGAEGDVNAALAAVNAWHNTWAPDSPSNLCKVTTNPDEHNEVKEELLDLVAQLKARLASRSHSKSCWTQQRSERSGNASI